MSSEQTRIESDSMGQMQVPDWALWGAQTQRAVENFPVSGYRFGRRFIRAMGLIKGAAAQVNRELGLLDAKRADWILAAAQEVTTQAGLPFPARHLPNRFGHQHQHETPTR